MSKAIFKSPYFIILSCLILSISCTNEVEETPMNEQDILVTLESISEFTVTEIPTVDHFQRLFEIRLLQPLDHNNPGGESFEQLHSEDAVKSFVVKYFPDLEPLLPSLINEWFKNPLGSLITTKTSQWYYSDWAVLVGDACHAQYPFYGQGMNSAFEDCCLLMTSMKKNEENLEAAFRLYEQERRPHTDALAELSKENFIELKETVKSPLLAIRKKIDLTLNHFFPNAWKPLYTMIAHSTIPYGVAKVKAVRQQRIINIFGLTIFASVCSGCVFMLLGFLS